MKNFVAAFDGLKYSHSAQQYAIDLAKLCDAQLTGIFLSEPTYTSHTISELLTEQGVSEKKLIDLWEKDEKTRESAVEKFRIACEKEGLAYSIKLFQSEAIDQLKRQSIYADLIIIDAQETLTHYPEKLPTRFMVDLLTNLQCPILIVPPTYKSIKKIILLYDGEPSAVYAIKLFSYLVGDLNQVETEVVSVVPSDSALVAAEPKDMEAFIAIHYPKMVYKLQQGKPATEIIKYLNQQDKHAMIVLGAYGRGPVSRWFRKSMADILMNEVEMPLFIARN